MLLFAVRRVERKKNRKFLRNFQLRLLPQAYLV